MNANKLFQPQKHIENETEIIHPASLLSSPENTPKEHRILRRFIAASCISLWGRGLYFRQKRRIIFDAGRNKLTTLRNLPIKIKNLLSTNKINQDILENGKSDILKKDSIYDIYAIDKQKTHVGYIAQGYYYEINDDHDDPAGEIDRDGSLRFFAKNFDIQKRTSAIIKNGILTTDSDGIQYAIRERPL